MKRLMKKVNKFYKKYDVSNLDNTTRLTKDDMYDMDKLMTAYEAIWISLEYYDDRVPRQFMTNLYDELSDYMDNIPKKHKHRTCAIFMFGISECGTMGVGMFIAALFAYGYDPLFIVGIICALIVAIGYGLIARRTIHND